MSCCGQRHILFPFSLYQFILLFCPSETLLCSSKKKTCILIVLRAINAPLVNYFILFGASPKLTIIIINECDNLNLPVAKDILTLGCKPYIHMIPFCRKLWLNIIVICFKSNDVKSCVKQNQKACFCWISLLIKNAFFEYCLHHMHHVKKKKADLFTYFVSKTKRCAQVRVRLNSKKPIILLWKNPFYILSCL